MPGRNLAEAAGSLSVLKEKEKISGKSQTEKSRRRGETVIESLLKASAAISILTIVLITVFIFARGIPLLLHEGIFEFLLETRWAPTRGSFGIGTMVVGSLAVTLGSLLWAVPLGLLVAIFMAEIAPKEIGRLMSSLVELLAGIPSIVYGFFGLIVIIPAIREYLGGTGFSVLAGVLVLGVMILPTIINISRDSILAVPIDYKTGSLALGATHFQTIRRVVLPAARSGIITAIVLGMGRAVGETMAVVMVTGNSTIIPDGILSSTRTMTSNIVLEMGYASGEHQAALFATGAALFVFIILLNLVVNVAAKAGMQNEGGQV